MIYKTIIKNGKEYTICEYNHTNIHGTKIKNYFIIDTEDLDKIKDITWFRIKKHIGNRNAVYLHNFIMDCETNNYTHINKNINDNRKCNLKYVSDDEKIYNYNRRQRIELPEDSGIDVDELPKNVWFNSSSNKFVVKNYHNNKLWYSTSSSKYSLRFKLEETKNYLRYLYNEYPDLYNDDICSNMSKNSIKSLKKFNNILLCSGFELFINSIVEIPEYKNYLEPVILSNDEMTELKNLEKYYTLDTLVKKNVPISSKTYFLPEYVLYKSPDEKNMGECFMIQNHPEILKKSGKKKIKTTSKKNVSTIQKYKELKNIFKKYGCEFK